MLQHTIYSSSNVRERGVGGMDGEGELGLGHIRSLIFIGSSKGYMLLDLWTRHVPWGFHNLSNL